MSLKRLSEDEYTLIQDHLKNIIKVEIYQLILYRILSG